MDVVGARRYPEAVNALAPERRIVSFVRDAAGDFCAELECGHRQHVRHRPPLELRPWVLTEAGRRGRLGATLPCRNCLMPALPPGLAVYKTTSWFDADSTPAGLLSSHRLRAGTWGRIRVEHGVVVYTIEGSDELSFALTARLPGIVEPERPHRVAPSADARFRLEFLR